MADPPEAVNNAVEQLEERPAIAVVSIHGCARVAACSHVVDPAADLETERGAQREQAKRDTALVAVTGAGLSRVRHRKT